MPKDGRNAFNSGEFSPEMYARTDLEQYPHGLENGLNMILKPQGVATRRPGSGWVFTLATIPKAARFKFNREQQYGILFRNLLLDVVQDDVVLTQVVTPWSTALTDEIDWAQSADTMIITHEDIPPYVLRRLAMDAISGPAESFNTTTTMHIHALSHGLLSGDEVGVSLVGDGGTPGFIGGVPLAEINTSHAVTLVGFALNLDPLTSGVLGSTTMDVEITAHGLAVGDRFELEGLEEVPGSGVPPNEVNRVQTVTNVVDANHVEFSVETESISSQVGGGIGSTWEAVDKFAITVTTTATSDERSGGTVAKTWALNSMQPKTVGNPKNKIELENISTFNFNDQLTGPPNDEVQEILFGGTWADRETFKLEFAGTPTPAILYDGADPLVTASRMQSALRGLANTSNSGITVVYDTGGPGGGDNYIVTFTGKEGGREIALLDVSVASSSGGSISASEAVKGGSLLEPSMSTARGWPKTVAFFEARLCFAGLKSRPSAFIASKSRSFYDFDTGDSRDADAIDADGQFNPVLHLFAGRRLFMLTSEGEVLIGGGENGITPDTVSFDEDNTIGSTDVRPVALDGKPLFVDRTNRGIRQLAFDVTPDQFVANELTTLSQHLINTPVDMAVLRNKDGDYVYVVNTDGTIAVLNSNAEQGVLGWTPFSTDGLYKRVVEISDTMYTVVERTVGGGPVYFFEKFDETFLLDASVRATHAGQSAWSGFTHLEGVALAVRGAIDGATELATLDDATVSSGAITSNISGVVSSSTDLEAGLRVLPHLRPLPPSPGRKIRIPAVELDLLDSRAVLVNGFPIPSRKFPNAFVNPPALLNGPYRMRVKGISDRASVSITQTEPQPMTIRGLSFEVK